MTPHPPSALLILTQLGHLYLVNNRTFLLGLDTPILWTLPSLGVANRVKDGKEPKEKKKTPGRRRPGIFW